MQAETENAEPSLKEVWDYASTSQPIAARNVLDDLEGLDARTEALANLVLDLSRAPISEGDWAKIEPALGELAEGDDEVAARALYLQARMHQVHLLKPDYARAEARQVGTECKSRRALSITSADHTDVDGSLTVTTTTTATGGRGEIGRASCRERVEISVVAVSLKNQSSRALLAQLKLHYLLPKN